MKNSVKCTGYEGREKVVLEHGVKKTTPRSCDKRGGLTEYTPKRGNIVMVCRGKEERREGQTEEMKNTEKYTQSSRLP